MNEQNINTNSGEITQVAAADLIPEARRAYSRSMLNLFIYSIAAIIAVNIFAFLFRSQLQDNIALSYIISFGSMYLIAFPIYLLVSKKVPASPPSQEYQMKPHHFIMAFICMEGLCIAGNLIGTVINFILSQIVGYNTSSTFLIEGVFGNASTVFVIIAVLIGPVIEEILFRKILLDRIQKYGTLPALLISGITFGLFHGNFSQFFYAAFIGLFLAYIYLRTGKVINTIILHIMMNFWGSAIPMILLHKVDSETLVNALTNNDITSLGSSLQSMIPFFIFTAFNFMIAIGGIIMLCLNASRFSLPESEAPVPKGKRFKTSVLNIGFLLFILYIAYEFVSQLFLNG
ncbi:MAG: CPBP family intramembrane metalloprotease [Oscillospiraceae bacterium]|nr:CPBP family intramembrane metalloprotease [Oscillospiraceae bacterium]